MRSLILSLSVILALTLPAAPVTASPAACAGLFISEYVEGSSNNKAIEIFNGTGQAVDLAGYTLEFYFNGAPTPGATISLAGALPDGDVLRRRRPRSCGRNSRRCRSNLHLQLLQRRRCRRPQAWCNRAGRDRPGRVRPRHFVGQRLDHHTGPHAAPEGLGQHRRPNASNTFDPVLEWDFNGDDAIVLKRGATVLDVIGQVGFNPGTSWGSGSTTTQDHTLRRKRSVSTGDTNPSNAFDPAVEWDGYPVNTCRPGQPCRGLRRCVRPMRRPGNAHSRHPGQRRGQPIGGQHGNRRGRRGWRLSGNDHRPIRLLPGRA